MSGRDDDPRAGYPNGGPRETPADLAVVQADDALLDMLGSANPTPGDIDGELTRVLAAWRREVHADSNRVLVDTDTALAVIKAARRPTRRRNPVFGSLAAAAAVLVIAFSTVGLVAKSAQPGDQLWGVTEVLYGDYARSVETAASVRTELTKAQEAFQQGKPEQAKSLLRGIQKQLPAIGEGEGLTDLTALHQDLEKKVDKQVGVATQGPSTGSGDPRTPAGSVAPEPSTSSSTPTPTPQSTPTPETSPTPEPSPAPEPPPTLKPDRPTTRGDDLPSPTRVPPPPPDVDTSPDRPDRPDPRDTAPDSGSPPGSGAGGPGVPSPPG